MFVVVSTSTDETDVINCNIANILNAR